MHADDFGTQGRGCATVSAGSSALREVARRRGVAKSLLRGMASAPICYLPHALGNSSTPVTSVAVSPVSAGSLMQVTLGLAAVVALIVLLAWLVRRFGPFQGGGPAAVRLIGGVSLGQRERAVLVQVGTKQILLGVAPGNVRTLHVFDEPVTDLALNTEEGTATPTRSAGGGFAERLQTALGERMRP